MPTINNRNRLQNTRVCSIYTDAAALREAEQKIKRLRSGKSVIIDMMSFNAVEQLMDLYNENHYLIEAESIDDSTYFYRVRIHRYSFFEKLFSAPVTHRSNVFACKCYAGEDSIW